jgi:3,4-dihydroxy 2-butanone 4-phosphate synthase/GTP cyclohydrolase II
MKTPYLVPPTGSPPTDDAVTEAISPIEDIIEDARNGRPYILVDAEDRENEGDVIIPAQFATPEQINFMAKHARGLICLSITAERARALRLPPMASDNQSGHGTAFTVSIAPSMSSAMSTRCMRTRVGLSGSMRPLVRTTCSVWSMELR